MKNTHNSVCNKWQKYNYAYNINNIQTKAYYFNN